MEIYKEEDYLGKICLLHGTIIRKGKYGLWCGKKTFQGWCQGIRNPDTAETFRKIEQQTKNIKD